MREKKTGILLLKVLEAEYANSLFGKGELKFSNARKWIEDENKYGHGKGDQFEAIFARIPSRFKITMNIIEKLYEDIEASIDDNYINFRVKRSLDLPATCFYLIDIDEDASDQVEHKISSEYYRDFGNNTDKINLVDKKWMSTVIIRNIDDFKSRLTKALTDIGVKESEIMFSKLHYESKIRNSTFFNTKQPPTELFFKDNSLEYQNELRVVINTDDDEVTSYLYNNPLVIGNLKDIAKIEFRVPHDDTQVIYIKKK
ncbi:hypothetical protein ACR6HW_04040 [Fusibacter sp. JL298sf-3]